MRAAIRCALVVLALAASPAWGAGIIQGPEKIDPSDTADSTLAYIKIPHTRTIAARDTSAANFFGFGGYKFLDAFLSLSTVPDTTFGTADDVGGFRLMVIGGPPNNNDTLRVIGNHVSDAFNTVSFLDTSFIYMPAGDSSGTYYQTDEKWSGELELSLTDDSAVGARNVNVGGVRFFDNLGVDYTLTDFHVDGLFGATQTNLKMWLREHQTSGWLFDGTGGFTAASYPAPIIKLSDVQSADDTAVALLPFGWVQTGVNRVIEGSAGHGFVLHVQTLTDHAMGPMNATIWTTTP